MAALPDDLAGRVFAHYRVIERIGAGGMGLIYRAHDQTLQRDVVIKLLPQESIGDAAARVRLLDEARKAAGLGHPNICTIHEVGEAEGQVYLAMEWVQGRTLQDTIGPRGMPLGQAIAIAIQIADAAAHAHDRGIIHRDLKSANVILTPEGRVKVLDFGIARRVDPETHASPVDSTTHPEGAVVGTMHYLPPEAFRGERADARGDVWALGVLMHEMLTGAFPFRGSTGFELGAAVLNAEPEPLPPDVPASLRSVIQRCLVKDAAGRFQRASEVRAVLEMIRAEATTGPATLPSPPIASPRRPRRRAPAAWAGLALLIVAAVLAVFLGRTRGGAGAIRSLAVLPLENLSHDPEQDYFVDGMTEELITSLANLEGVRVISRTSSMRYKDTKKSSPEIARELGVDGVVEGSAMREGNRVRITAQLIDAARDRHVWAKSYERDLTQVLSLQAEVAAAIAGEIRVALTETGRSRTTHAHAVDPQAYEDYLKGRFHWAKRSPESFRKAEGFFVRAIARDPDYAEAHAGLADVYAVRSDLGDIPPSQTAAKARAAVNRALELNDQLAEPHATLGMIHFKFDHDLPGTASELRKAIALNPNYATAHQWYATYLSYVGRPAEALAEFERAQRLDPLSPVIRWNRASTLMNLRRYDEAEAVAREAVELDPTSVAAHLHLARVHLRQKDYARALAEFDQSDSLNSAIHRDPEIRAALSKGDMRRYWSQMLRWAKDRARKQYVSPNVFAVLYARLGERDSALVWMERVFDEPEGGILSSLRGDALDSLRGDPRYDALLRKHGLEP